MRSRFLILVSKYIYFQEFLKEPLNETENLPLSRAQDQSCILNLFSLAAILISNLPHSIVGDSVPGLFKNGEVEFVPHRMPFAMLCCQHC